MRPIPLTIARETSVASRIPECNWRRSALLIRPRGRARQEHPGGQRSGMQRDRHAIAGKAGNHGCLIAHAPQPIARRRRRRQEIHKESARWPEAAPTAALRRARRSAIAGLPCAISASNSIHPPLRCNRERRTTKHRLARSSSTSRARHSHQQTGRAPSRRAGLDLRRREPPVHLEPDQIVLRAGRPRPSAQVVLARSQKHTPRLKQMRHRNRRRPIRFAPRWRRVTAIPRRTPAPASRAR